MSAAGEAFTRAYLHETMSILLAQDAAEIQRCVDMLSELRARRGRLFVLGNGGSAANASHAVNDFRKLCGIEAYAPTDNVAELTARANDDGWASTFDAWLQTSRLRQDDMLLVLSVGGGSTRVGGASPNISDAVEYALELGVPILAIVGRNNGVAAQHADEYLIAACLEPARVTPHAEEFQSVMCHLLANHPDLKLP